MSSGVLKQAGAGFHRLPARAHPENDNINSFGMAPRIKLMLNSAARD